MKTSVNIVRKLNDFDVIQRTGDGMFNATSLLKLWNKENPENQKRIDNFWQVTNLDELMEEIITNEPEFKDVNLSSLKSTDDKKSKSLKSTELKNLLSKTSKANKGINAGTWMNPYLFIKFAMWLNPKFEYHVIKFVYDELIKHRNLSGDYYKQLCSLLARFKDTNFSDVGKILNLVVFNEHKSERRNYATSEQQNELQQLTRDACMLLEDGFIRSWDKFKEYMREKWRSRHSKVPKQLI